MIKNKNVFYTGGKGAGKSIHIKNTLRDFNGTVGGFVIVEYRIGGISGFILRDRLTEKESLIGVRKDNGCIGITEAFETSGVIALENALNANVDLIIMDELGFLENEVVLFQQTVFACLDSEIPVVGALKLMSTPFLDAVRSRGDVVVIEVK